MNRVRFTALCVGVLSVLLFPSCADDAARDVDAGTVVDAGASDAAMPDVPMVNDAGAGDSSIGDDGALVDMAVVEDMGVPEDGSLPTDGGTSFAISRACPAFAGGSANGECVFPQVSFDGRFVAFASDATDMLAEPLVNPVGSAPLSRYFVRDTELNVTELVSFDATTSPAGSPYSPLPPAISGDGRYVVFALPANAWDSVTYSSPNPTLLLLRDRMLGSTTIVSQRADGALYSGSGAAISGDGHSLVLRTTYSLTAPSLGFGDEQIYLRDLTGDGDDVEIVSIGPDGMPASAGSTIFGDFDVSDDGSKVVFATNAANFLVGVEAAGVPAWMKHCFVRDRVAGTTVRVDVASVGETGDWANNECSWATISGNGRFVAFATSASNIVPGDTNGYDDVFVRDLVSGVTERVSLSDADAEVTDAAPISTATSIRELDISYDGDWVVFLSFSHALIADDTATEAGRQGFARRRSAGRTYRFTLHPDGTEFTDSQAALIPRIAGDASSIVFTGYREGIFPDSSGAYELFAVETSAL